MKKIVLSGFTAIILAASVAGMAEAKGPFDGLNTNNGPFGGLNKHSHCSTTKIIKIGRHGKKSVTIIKKCR